ncbi:hypothetical protein H2C59_002651 [Salmonella enterica]|nr:hypothetical protein [Salmonella enterica subsp. enterica serovar Treforest]EEE6682745.1 hypothetical protein [Salmonella enterica subsp. diarizonae]EFQ7045615.1 hypothetical protein [Salmonella enterica]EGA6373016.1 hypothetical protein [Salmonella enterica]EHC0799969.1 hypothetical protein [Salmonella enterica]
MREEKIITIYPTVVKPGLAIVPLMTPDPLILAQDYPSFSSFYLTAIMYFEHGKKYTTEIDVTFNGESVLPEVSSDHGQLQTFMFSPINEKYVAVGTYLFVKDIKLIGTGTYDVVYRLFEDIDGNLSEVIDEKKCALISTIPARGKE